MLFRMVVGGRLVVVVCFGADDGKEGRGGELLRKEVGCPLTEN